MMKRNRYVRTTLWLFALAAFSVIHPGTAMSDWQLDRDVDAALSDLYETTPAARAFAAQARAILVFPNVVRSGFIVARQEGDGALIKNGRKVAYYASSARPVDFQAGARYFAFAIFFMNDRALRGLERSKDFEIGVRPNILFMGGGAAGSINAAPAQSDVYGFVFDYDGLVPNVGLQGTEIIKLSH